MTKEQKMVLFEKSCVDWEFDFDKDDNSQNYSSYETGIMFGMFLVGFDKAVEHFGIEEK